MMAFKTAPARAHHQNNIRKYRRLLETELTSLECDYIKKRLDEECSALAELEPTAAPSLPAA